LRKLSTFVKITLENVNSGQPSEIHGFSDVPHLIGKARVIASLSNFMYWQFMDAYQVHTILAC
jgi:hypothetical protein